MTIEDIQAICMKLPGVTQDIKWEVYIKQAYGLIASKLPLRIKKKIKM